MEKEILCLKKDKFTTKDNRVIYRLHLWVDDGIVDYCICNVDENIYNYAEEMSKFYIAYELKVFNKQVQGIKNVRLV